MHVPGHKYDYCLLLPTIVPTTAYHSLLLPKGLLLPSYYCLLLPTTAYHSLLLPKGLLLPTTAYTTAYYCLATTAYYCL